MLTLLFSILSLAFAHESPKIYTHKIFKEVGSYGDVHVMVHSNGHLIGNKYVVQIRPDCEKSGENWRQLEIKDSESACQVDRNGIEVNRSTMEIFVKIFAMDREQFQKDLMSKPIQAEPKCLKESSVLKFDLKELCAKDQN